MLLRKSILFWVNKYLLVPVLNTHVFPFLVMRCICLIFCFYCEFLGFPSCCSMSFLEFSVIPRGLLSKLSMLACQWSVSSLVYCQETLGLIKGCQLLCCVVPFYRYTMKCAIFDLLFCWFFFLLHFFLFCLLARHSNLKRDD